MIKVNRGLSPRLAVLTAVLMTTELTWDAILYQMAQRNRPDDLNLQLYLLSASVSSNYLEQAILFQTDG
jgi:hypothetical protein